jgi:DNA-binding response OmpR family regulator
MEKIKHILIVDDTADFREIFSLKLMSAGFEVMTAVNGQEGVEKARTFKPDLVLLDMQMPGLSGAETLNMIRKDPDSKDVKVLFLSSLGNIDEQSRDVNDKAARDMGAAGYMKKSDDLDKIVERIRTVLGS